jgi:hypothetical protein
MIAALPVMAAQPETDWGNWPDSLTGRPEFWIGSRFIETNGPRSLWYFIIARWACIPLSVLGGIVCFQWARELNGTHAGVLALILWCFCPNILGNGQLITPDTGAAALGAAANYSFWRWLQKPTWIRAFIAGVVFGLAQLTKTTWVILFALWPLLWIICRLSDGQRRTSKTWARQAAQVAFVFLVGLDLLNVGYTFEGSFTKLKDYFFISEALGGPRGTLLRMEHNRFKATWLGSVPIPLPADYVLGIDRQKVDFENRLLSYFRGEWRLGGWWYYYIYGLAIKVPLGTWFLVFLGAILPILSKNTCMGWRDQMFLLAPPATIIILVSSQTGFNHHLRYVLPIFPFIFIWVSKVADSTLLMNWKWAVMVGSALAWSIISSLSVFPHSLSYFNELTGGPKGGPNHLVDSNVDWGQDLLFLKKWVDDHPEANPLGLVYFGYFDPRIAGIHFNLPPARPIAGDNSQTADFDTGGPRPGWYAISVTMLKGYKFPIPDGNGGTVNVGQPYYTYFQGFEPVAMAGYSIYIYHVSLDDANRVRKELGLEELTSEEAAENGK